MWAPTSDLSKREVWAGMVAKWKPHCLVGLSPNPPLKRSPPPLPLTLDHPSRLYMKLTGTQSTQLSSVPVCSLICVPFLETPWTVVCQASLSIGIFQARILEWVAISSSRALPNQGIERTSPATLALQADSLPLSHRGSLQLSPRCNLKSQELTFGKVASDSKNVLAQGEIYSSDERGGDQGREGSKIPSVPPGASAAIVLFYEASLSSSEKKWHDCSMHISSWRGSFPCCAFSPLAQVFLKPKLRLSDPKSDSFSSPHWDCGIDFSLGSEQQMAD